MPILLLKILAKKRLIGIVLGAVAGGMSAAGIDPSLVHWLAVAAGTTFVAGVTPSDKEANEKVAVKEIKEIMAKDPSYLRTDDK